MRIPIRVELLIPMTEAVSDGSASSVANACLAGIAKIASVRKAMRSMAVISKNGTIGSKKGIMHIVILVIMIAS